MAKTATINARVDERLKAKAKKVLRRVGISWSEAVTMLLHQISLQQAVPFDVRTPNVKTQQAMTDLDAGKGDRFNGSAQGLFKSVLGNRAKSGS